jgi:hypothetical protein
MPAKENQCPFATAESYREIIRYLGGEIPPPDGAEPSQRKSTDKRFAAHS